MTAPEILKALEPYTGQFPMEAMREAVAQRDAIKPELLRVLETVADRPAEFAKRREYMLHLFALYLLAQFREKRAYPAIVKMFSAPGEIPFDLAGDTVTEGLGQILASVYNGDPGLLLGLVANRDANEFVRGAAMDAFLVLEKEGAMPRSEVVDHLRSLFQGGLERVPSYAWDALASTVADLPAPELLEEVREAFRQNLTDPTVADLDYLEREMASPPVGRRERYRYITDAISEMEWWSSFHPEDELEAFAEPEPLEAVQPAPSLPAAAPVEDYEPPRPFVREPKIGRNDPCPCGSGKKYKKCCG
jgi:hypothetical protein